MSTLHAATWNGWVGQRPAAGRANLEQLLEDTGRPDVLAGQELSWLDGTIPGYRRHAADDHPRREGDRNVLLIRRDLNVHRTGLLVMHHDRWIGPKPRGAQWHEPRIYPWAVVSHPGERRRWPVLDVHRITSSDGKNEAQRAAELEQLETFLAAMHVRHPRRPLVALGDWNGTAYAGLARRLDADLALIEVDGALALNARVTRVRKLKSRYGSDSHNPVSVTLEAGKAPA